VCLFCSSTRSEVLVHFPPLHPTGSFWFVPQLRSGPQSCAGDSCWVRSLLPQDIARWPDWFFPALSCAADWFWSFSMCFRSPPVRLCSSFIFSVSDFRSQDLDFVFHRSSSLPLWLRFLRFWSAADSFSRSRFHFRPHGSDFSFVPNKRARRLQPLLAFWFWSCSIYLASACQGF
jgi:hypothetical protein